MLAQNPLGERFNVPDADPDRLRSRWSTPQAFLRAVEALEDAPSQLKLEGEHEAHRRSFLASKNADKALFEVRVWATVREFCEKHGLSGDGATIDAMCEWQNYAWSQPFNVFSHNHYLCDLMDREKCLVTKGYRPDSSNLEDAIVKAGVAFKEEYEANLATIPFDVAHSGDPTVEACNELSAKRVFNSRLDWVALTTRGVYDSISRA